MPSNLVDELLQVAQGCCWSSGKHSAIQKQWERDNKNPPWAAELSAAKSQGKDEVLKLKLKFLEHLRAKSSTAIKTIQSSTSSESKKGDAVHKLFSQLVEAYSGDVQAATNHAEFCRENHQDDGQEPALYIPFDKLTKKEKFLYKEDIYSFVDERKRTNTREDSIVFNPINNAGSDGPPTKVQKTESKAKAKAKPGSKATMAWTDVKESQKVIRSLKSTWGNLSQRCSTLKMTGQSADFNWMQQDDIIKDAVKSWEDDFDKIQKSPFYSSHLLTKAFPKMADSDFLTQAAANGESLSNMLAELGLKVSRAEAIVSLKTQAKEAKGSQEAA